MSSKVMSQELDVLMQCQGIDDLEAFYATKSLGGELGIQTEDRLVFVQSFPYSGVDASHLYAYAQEDAVLEFLCFFRLETQEIADFGANKDGSVTIRIGDERVCILHQPPEVKKHPN